jgi:hypothetical protein
MSEVTTRLTNRNQKTGKKVKTDSEVQGPLVDHIDRLSMDATSYSALD